MGDAGGEALDGVPGADDQPGAPLGAWMAMPSAVRAPIEYPQNAARSAPTSSNTAVTDATRRSSAYAAASCGPSLAPRPSGSMAITVWVASRTSV
ncbi:hypothetical protein SAZ11_27050 [Streptomyces sp. FXJ1.4098]|nr:hypothetical protein [Streptomyces sp. FXJ1.4098]